MKWIVAWTCVEANSRCAAVREVAWEPEGVDAGGERRIAVNMASSQDVSTATPAAPRSASRRPFQSAPRPIAQLSASTPDERRQGRRVLNGPSSVDGPRCRS